MHGSPSLCTYNNMPVHGYEEGPAISFLRELETVKSVGENVVMDERRERGRRVLSGKLTRIDKRVEDD